MLKPEDRMYDKKFIDCLLKDLFEYLTYNRVVLQWTNIILEKINRNIEKFDLDKPVEHDKIDLAERHIYKWMNDN